MTSYFLGVDCGSTMAKAAIFDTTGRELAGCSEKIEHIYLNPGWTENDMDALWKCVAKAIRQTITQSGIDPTKIACVACAGHGNGLYLVDRDGKPARNGIISSDARARKYIDQWNAEKTLDKIITKTMQAIWPAQPNALLRWLMDNEPDVIARTKYLFMCKDFIRYRLTGEAYMELSDMSGTSLINVVTGEYDDEVLETWGLLSLKSILPPLKKSAEICGKITKEAATQTGIPEGTPVAGGVFDIDACGLSVGMTDDTQLCMVAGTWGNNQYISKTPVATTDIFMTSRYCIDDYYLMLEGSATSASNLEWIVTQLFQADKELLKQSGSDKSIYHFCGELVAGTKPNESGVIFLPYMYGCPVSLDGKGVFFGLDGRYNRAQWIRSVFEGIIFGHKWHTQRLLQYCRPPQTIRLTGGVTNSDVWSQMFADVFQIPVEIPQGSEFGCFGAAICGTVAVGLYDSYETACNKMVKIERVYQPNSEFADIYAKKYSRFLKLLETLEPAWGELKW